MESWRVVLGGIVFVGSAVCAVVAVLAMMGKGLLPPDKVMLRGTAEEKEAYKKAAYGRIAIKYICMALITAGLGVITLKAEPIMIFITCGILCGATLIVSKMK